MCAIVTGSVHSLVRASARLFHRCAVCLDLQTLRLSELRFGVFLSLLLGLCCCWRETFDPLGSFLDPLVLVQRGLQLTMLSVRLVADEPYLDARLFRVAARFASAVASSLMSPTLMRSTRVASSGAK